MASELRVDRIIPVNGVPTGGGGGIVQIVQGSTSTQVNVTTSTFADTGLTATITPTSTSSKILVMVNQQFYINSAVNYTYMGMRVYRDSTIIHAPVQDATGSYEWGLNQQNAAGNPNFSQFCGRATIEILDSPSTTSAVTYKTQGRPYNNQSSTGLFYNSYGAVSNGTSYITLMEVSG